MKLGFFQIFLPKSDQFELFDVDGKIEKRSEFLSRIFESDFVFEHRKKQYYYTFIYKNENLLQGRIGRSVNIDANEGPEKRLEPATFKHWKAYDVFF